MFKLCHIIFKDFLLELSFSFSDAMLVSGGVLVNCNHNITINCYFYRLQCNTILVV